MLPLRVGAALPRLAKAAWHKPLPPKRVEVHVADQDADFAIWSSVDLLADALQRVAGIQLHQGKARVWSRAGEQPPDVADLGSDVWSPEGVVVLGTPLGRPVLPVCGPICAAQS